MKALRKIGMAILLVVICGMFSACGNNGDNDDEDDVFNAKEASLVIGTWHGGFGKGDYLIFELDGTYIACTSQKGKYLVNNKRGIIKLFNRKNRDVVLEDVELRFAMSDNDHLRIEWVYSDGERKFLNFYRVN